MSLEGELQLTLRLQDARIAGVDIRSTRPDIALNLLEGRRIDEVQAAVPRLFSVCSRSQATACQLAHSAAVGALPDAAALALARTALAEEMVRETAWQALLHLPRWADETPTAEATAAARAAQIWRAGGDAQSDTAGAISIAHAIFGCTAQAWLQRTTWPALSDWAEGGATATARYLHRLASEAPVIATDEATPLLPPPTPDGLLALAAAAAADPAFARHPHWHGRAVETGALARLQDDPLFGSQALPAPPRPLARLVARLRELALLLTGRYAPGLGALTLAPGSGIGWADNARGLLLHHVQLDGEDVRLYRIVAPTEWNFHPQGALTQALLGAAFIDANAARLAALRLVNSLDPCVRCSVEVSDA